MRSVISASLDYAPEELCQRFLTTARRVLLFGESGSGKSTLTATLARILDQAGRECFCIGADPGSPAFGVPGAVCLGRWQGGGWQLLTLEALCTLDAARFRLPLIFAVQRLARRAGKGMLLIDAPGVVRGVAGAELLAGIVEGASVDTILVLAHGHKPLPLANELETSGCAVIHVQPAEEARRPGTRQRMRRRTRLWDGYLAAATETTMTLPPARFIGTVPPLDAEKEWQGRQLALLRQGRTLAMGEVLAIRKNRIRVRIKAIPAPPDQYLFRDAHRNSQGLLVTRQPGREATLHYIPPPDMAPYSALGKTTGPLPVARLREATATLVNGIFGDPLLHLRIHNQKRSVLFDLGEGGRLPARLAHQISEVFISHAHIDHISGFFWLLRSRIGLTQPCSLFGPPGLAAHIGGLLAGIHWDRIGDWGPRFEVGEIHGNQLFIHPLQAGREASGTVRAEAITDGLIVDDPRFKVRAAILEHSATPVLAYSLELPARLNVRKERLGALGIAAGPWLRELKRLFAADAGTTRIHLPDGSSATVEKLAGELLQITPPAKMVYATDLGDTETNRRQLSALARDVHTFFCEAAFCEADRRHSERSGHLTARACGEIAQEAGVGQLVPFHFSRRYEKNPLQIYDEVRASCRRVAVPQFLEPAG